MPTTLDYGIVVPAAGTEPPDINGIANRLGASTVAAFDTYVTPSDWTAPTFANSWVNYGGSNQVAEYRKTGDVVELRGLVKDGSVATMFTLPSGFRPNAIEHFLVDASAGVAEILIGTGGTVSMNVYKASGTNAYVSLAGIRFSVTA